MLSLTRKPDQKLILMVEDVVITITVVPVGGNKVRVGIEAPPLVRVFREEILKVKEKKDV